MYYLGFLVSIDGVQPLPEKVTAIEALQSPKDINKLRQFLGLLGFYRKFIPFFAGVTACLNTMLQKGATLHLTTHYKNALKLLEAELVKMPALQYPSPNKEFKLFREASKHSYSEILHQEKLSDMPGSETSLILIAYILGSFGRTQQLWKQLRRSVMQSTDQLKNCILS